MGAADSKAELPTPSSAVFRFARSEAQQEAVTLFWVRGLRSNRVQGLSSNVIREICAFLCRPPVLAFVQPNEVAMFDCRNQRWTRPMPVKKRLDVDKYTSSTIVDDGRIFCCGGGSSYRNAYLLHPSEGSYTVVELARMYSYRQYPGLLYDASLREVLVFGGSDSKQELRSCEKLCLQRQQWQEMPEMICARRFFTPCRRRELVYLCGGWSYTVETYDLCSGVFQPVGLKLPESSWSSAVIVADELIVLSENTISRWNLREERQLEGRTHLSFKTWSRSSPVIIDDIVFILPCCDNKLAKLVDLNTGEVVEKC